MSKVLILLNFFVAGLLMGCTKSGPSNEVLTECAQRRLQLRESWGELQFDLKESDREQAKMGDAELVRFMLKGTVSLKAKMDLTCANLDRMMALLKEDSMSRKSVPMGCSEGKYSGFSNAEELNKKSVSVKAGQKSPAYPVAFEIRANLAQKPVVWGCEEYK